jgi:hypothetical protein
VTGAPCISIGASNVTLDLNGYSITARAIRKLGAAGPSPMSLGS